MKKWQRPALHSIAPVLSKAEGAGQLEAPEQVDTEPIPGCGGQGFDKANSYRAIA